MKRHLAWLLALAVVAYPSGPAAAELLKNFHFTGQIDVQVTNANNVSDFASQANPNAKYPPTAGQPAAGGGWTVGTPCVGANCAPSNRDRINDVQTRIMLNADWDILDDVHAKVSLAKNDRAWGTGGGNQLTNDAQSQTLVGGNAKSGTNAGVTNNIFVTQANFKVDKIAGQFDVTMGRQYFGDPNDLVIYFGPSEKAWYGLPFNAIDAARLDWGGAETITMTALAGVTKSGGVGTIPQADSNLFGIDFTGKAGDNAKASLYLWNKVTHNNAATGVAPTQGQGGGVVAGYSAGGKNDNLYVVGVKGKISGGGFWIKGEFDQDFGDNRVATDQSGYNADARHYIGYAMMGGLGFKAEDENAGMISIWGESAMGSGQSNTHENRNDGWAPINADYRPGSIYGRFAANGAFAGLGSGVANPFPTNTSITDSGLSNRVIWGAGIKLSPAVANKFQLGVSWWDFRIHRFADFPSYAPTPGGAAGNAGPGFAYAGNSHLGNELDVDVTWAHSENVSFSAGWARFMPGGAIYEAVKQANLAANGSFLGLGGTQAGTTQGVNPAMLVYSDVRVKF